MNYKYLPHIYTDENSFRREKLQFFFDRSFRENDSDTLRSQYIALRRLQLEHIPDFTAESINLSLLAENITSACDILVSDTGVSFIFLGTSPCFVRGSRRLITLSLVNLLSNAYLYGREKLITVTCTPGNQYSGVEVINGGSPREPVCDGMGLAFVRKCCDAMNGRFLIEQSFARTKAVMLFESSDIRTDKSREESCFSLVSDRLSPVCVEMFGMEYH